MSLRTWVMGLWIGVMLGGLLPIAAQASLARPNALDHRVDAITATALLHEPARALLDHDRQMAAGHLAHSTLLGWLLGAFLPALLLFYFWRSGWAARTRDALRRGVGSEGGVRALFGVALALLARLAGLLPAFYLYRVDRVMGISNQSALSWSGDWVRDTILTMLAGGVVVWVVLWLVERTHQWYLYTAAAIIVIGVASAYLNPFFAPLQERYEAASATLALRVRSMEERAGIATLPVVVEDHSLRSQLGVAEVQGLGATRRLVLSDTLLAGATHAEIGFAVARELRYVQRNDGLRRALDDALLVILGAALAVFVADRIRFRRDDDALSRIALVGALLACAYIVITPIDRAIQRTISADADHFAVAFTGQRIAAERAIVRESDQRMAQICPSLFTHIFVETNPSPNIRIARINGAAGSCP